MSKLKIMLKVIPIILCGGKGSRLWPLSRKGFPKQFLSLTGDNKKTLLQQTQERILDIKGIEDPIIICNEEHRFLVAEQMREINIKPQAIILEAEGKNTAPAITLGALKALENYKEDSILLILSADHIINDVKKFKKVLKKGFTYAANGDLVTFGIIPTHADTGYGYIESELLINKKNIEGSRIKPFIEKPQNELAKKLLKSNKYLWNSGMFIFKTSLILKELKNYSPEILTQCTKAMNNSVQDLDFIRIEKNEFSKVPNLPIDIAIMEKTKLGLVIPLDVGWSDIGNWKSLWGNEKKDLLGNVIRGKVFNKESSNCFIKSDHRLLVTLGLKDLIVIETPDAVLVANKEDTANLKEIVDDLIKKDFKEGLIHQKVFRPWGTYISLVKDKTWQVKRIEVKPFSSLSLQLHNHRAEHWTVVKGTAKIQIENEFLTLAENQSTFIPLGSKHRLSNPSSEKLVLIEIQSGKYLGEDDIVRFDDLYGRNSKI